MNLSRTNLQIDIVYQTFTITCLGRKLNSGMMKFWYSF